MTANSSLSLAAVNGVNYYRQTPLRASSNAPALVLASSTKYAFVFQLSQAPSDFSF